MLETVWADLPSFQHPQCIEDYAGLWACYKNLLVFQASQNNVCIFNLTFLFLFLRDMLGILGLRSSDAGAKQETKKKHINFNEWKWLDINFKLCIFYFLWNNNPQVLCFRNRSEILLENKIKIWNYKEKKHEIRK